MTSVCCVDSSSIVELTYVLIVSTFNSFYYYINVANSNTEWEIFVNGVSQNIYSSSSSGFSNCTYLKSINLIQLGNYIPGSLNITIVVLGSESGPLDRRSASDPMSLEVNMLL